MRRLSLLLILFLFSPVSAETPSGVVKTVYAGWKAIRPCYSSVEHDFLRRNKASFEPSFYEDLDKAYSYEDNMWPGYDLLFGGQVSVHGYFVGQSKVDGDKATVEVFVRLGLPGRPSQVNGYRVHLVQSPQGWQISDLDYGGRTLHEGVRSYLDFTANAESK